MSLCFAPWVWLISQKFTRGGTTGSLDWLTLPLVSDVMWFYATLNGNLNVRYTTVINLLIFGFSLCFFAWQIIRQKTLEATWQLLFFFAFAPVIIVFSLSYLLPKSIWETRYLIICAVPYTVLFVKGVFALPNNMIRSISIGIIFVWVLIAGFFNFQQAENKIKWSEAAEEIESANDDVAQPVYVFDAWVEMPLRFYLSERNSSTRVEKRADVDEIQGRNFWLTLRNPVAEENHQLREKLSEKNYCVAAEKVVAADSQSIVLMRVETCH